jgi:hypothetical protein
MAKIETTTLADSVFKKIKTLSIKESLSPALAEVYTSSAIDEMIDDILPRDVSVVTNYNDLITTYPANTNNDKFV